MSIVQILLDIPGVWTVFCKSKDETNKLKANFRQVRSYILIQSLDNKSETLTVMARNLFGVMA